MQRPHLVLLTVLVPGTGAPAQVEWEHFSSRSQHTLAYHETTDTVLAFGGRGSLGVLAEFSAYDGTGWTVSSGPGGPPPTLGGAMAHIPPLGITLLFGGTVGGTKTSQTWIFNGNSWGHHNPGVVPAARSGHGMAYMPSIGRVVLFGGIGLAGALDDTWEWDGTTWTSKTTSDRPSPGAVDGLAYDLASQRLVLCRGGFFSEIGEYDGHDWTVEADGISLPVRGCLGTAPNGGVVWFGGDDFFTFEVTDKLWHYQNGAWTFLGHGAPFRRLDAEATYVSSRNTLLLHGGKYSYNGEDTILSDTWEWDGNTWTQSTGATTPTASWGGTIAYDDARQRLLLHGGSIGNDSLGSLTLSGTYEWVNGRWNDIAGGLMIDQHGTVYDSDRDRLVSFGGILWDLESARTYEFDPVTATWTLVSDIFPSARVNPAMCYDKARQRTLLFGGRGPPTYQFNDETWEYDGTGWVQQSPATVPPATMGAVMCYDEHMQRPLLVSGGVWTYDGNDWILLDGTQPPGAGPCIYDRQRRRIVRPTGHEWTPQGWITRQLPTAMPNSWGTKWGAFGYDAASGDSIVFGGYVSAVGIIGDTWRYGATDPASSMSFGTGCPSAAQLTYSLTEIGMPPWIDSVYEVAVTPAPAPVLALGVLGVGDTTWAGNPLPLPLTGYGMPGCTLYIEPLLAQIVGSSWDIPIPDSPGLVAAPLYLQAFPFDALANTTGIIATSALELQFGIR